METLLDFSTVPGKESYKPGSEETNRFFYISIATEGCQEEVEYLNYINSIVDSKKVTKLKIIILNEFYKDSDKAKSDSHPKKRFEIIREWKQEIEDVEMDGDEDWLVCDRDNQSFKEDQYDELMNKAKQDNVKVVISNPAFQIWLLFHFVSDLSYLELDSIQRSKDRLIKVEDSLREKVPGYKHGSLNGKMGCFTQRIRNAIDNSRRDPNPLDLKQLKTKSGTNFSELLLSIEKWSGEKMYNGVDV